MVVYAEGDDRGRHSKKGGKSRCYSRPPKEERVITIGESENPGEEKEEKANS